MPAASRTYRLTTPCRIQRKDQSLRIERIEGAPVHIPITDVRDIAACESVDLNTAVISLLNRHHINVHFLSHYGDYAGSLLTAETSTSGQTVIAQARLADDPSASLSIARAIVTSAAANVRRVVDRKLLTRPMERLETAVTEASTREELMGAEGTFRRSAWAVMDTRLPDWLKLDGRSRRPPRNAGNAFISYVNGIVYARILSAVRLTPLHSGMAFLHSTMERQRHSLVLDLSEVFKPLFAERLLLRLSGRGQLKPHHFDIEVNQAMLSETGRKLVVQTVRDELAVTVQHRGLGRNVAYDELILRLCRQYLHHVQRSVFEGNLSPAQLRRFHHKVTDVIDASYDSVPVFTFPPGTKPERQEWGIGQPAPDDIL